MDSEDSQIKLRHNHSPPSVKSKSLDRPQDESQSTSEAISRRIRPRSASYAALRSAVFQLTSLSDFSLEKIGSGFFADVFKVKHKVTDEIMVLKMNKSRKTSKQMLSEIQLMNRLSHPNILKFKGSCVNEGQLHALTEYINGGSLEDILHNHSIDLSWSVRVKIARDIARGMAYLHSRGVFHRDLNSRNCLMKMFPDGRLHTVVADFGLAAKIKQRRRRNHTETVGSPYWMAPECLNGKNHCEQADVFSFGITLAEIVTRMPADPDFIPRTSHFGVNFEALRELCIGCPEELFQLMYRCCQMDPDDRPSFEEAVEIIEAIPVEDEPHTGDLTTFEPQSSNIAPLDAHVDIDLRGSVSEPFLRLTDPESDNRSCDSEGDVRRCIGHRLNSVGSSTGSSCGSLCDDSKHILADIAENPLPQSQTVIDTQSQNIPLACAIITNPVLENTILENGTTENGPNGISTEQWSEENPSKAEVGRYYRTIDSELSNGVEDPGTHRQLHKSKSLNLPEDNIKPDRHKAGRRASTDLNCSTKTLIADEDVTKDANDFANGGGDSGIDPGELEIFKFPPSSGIGFEPVKPVSRDLTTDEVVTEKMISKSESDEGEQTPICSSPTHYTILKILSPDTTQAGPGILKRHDHPIGAVTTSFEATPPPSLALVRTPSNESDNSMYEAPSSPFAQSWASSEFSFHLPHPSTPFAPPCTPVLPLRSTNSCPTSPTSLTKKYRYSQELNLSDFSSFDSPVSYQRRSTPSSSNRNSAIYLEYGNEVLDLNFESKESEKLNVHYPKRRSVHFLEDDNHLCSNLDRDHFSKAPHSRNRSHSNPAPPIIKQPVNYSLTLARQSPPIAEGSTATPKSADTNSLQYKGYNITLKSNARLSSSVPNLSLLSQSLY